METALRAALAAAARGPLPAALGACAHAVLSETGDPWAVVAHAGRLARCAWVPAPRDLGLTRTLRVVGVDHPRALVGVEAGAPFPTPGRAGRRRRGAWDTAPDLARRVVAAALAARRSDQARDPACGPGSFLVALVEAGVTTVQGADLDPLALAVARVAAPRARLTLRDAFAEAPPVPLVVGNPPYVSPEHQDKALRARLRGRFPWLRGRFDLAVPFAAASLEQVDAGGALSLLLPASLLSQPYAAPLRARWVAAHQLTWIQGLGAFPGASVHVAGVALRKGAGPAPVPPTGIAASALLQVPGVPLNTGLVDDDLIVLEGIHSRSVRLAELAEVDTGVVAHGPLGGKAALLHDHPGPGRVPYVDAADLLAGRLRWLAYRSEHMHRPKRPGLFEADKVLVQRIRGPGPVRAWVDRAGLYAGHTLSVVRPRDPAAWSAEEAHAFLCDPLVGGLLRLIRGPRLDLYPRDLADLPVPRARTGDLAVDWGLAPEVARRLRGLAP